MIISFIGSFSTGKTTLCNHLKQQLGNGWSYFDDYYRCTSLKLGYQSPRKAVLEAPDIRQITSTAMTASALGAMLQWIESVEHHGIIDTGLPSILSFHRYWLGVCGCPISPYVIRMAKEVMKKVDAYVYLPTGQLPLEDDGLRTIDPEFQRIIDKEIKLTCEDLGIPETAILEIPEEDLALRMKKCENLINTLQQQTQTR